MLAARRTPRERLLDFVVRLTPEDTPLFKMLGRRRRRLRFVRDDSELLPMPRRRRA
jgi:hypothetical protein